MKLEQAYLFMVCSKPDHSNNTVKHKYYINGKQNIKKPEEQRKKSLGCILRNFLNILKLKGVGFARPS